MAPAAPLRVGPGAAILVAAMKKQMKSNEVFAPNAVTKVTIKAAVIGRYAQSGPNKWDDYELTREDGSEQLELATESRIQVEPIGADPAVRFRTKRGKEVIICSWVTTAEDDKEIASGKWGVQEAAQASRIERILGLAPKNDPRDDMHEYFLDLVADPVH